MKFNIKFIEKFNIIMYSSQTLDLEESNLDITLNPYFKKLKLRVHKYGMYFYLSIPMEESKRKISDIIKLAYEFYNSKVDFIYLTTLPYDDIKMKAHKIYMKQGYVLWKDLVGFCKFKQLTTDSCSEDSIELILDYNI
jgi:hypothetical protein